MDRSWAIFNLHEEQSNENHISIKHSPKKKKRASLCLSARRNTLHGLGTSVMCGFYICVSNNEMLWQIFSSKLEVINRSKILLGTAQKMIEKANHFG